MCTYITYMWLLTVHFHKVLQFQILHHGMVKKEANSTSNKAERKEWFPFDLNTYNDNI